MKSKKYNNNTQYTINRKYKIEDLVFLYNL